MRLERNVQALLRAEFVLEHVRRVRKGLVDVAEPQLSVQREVGVLQPLEMLEVGKRAGRLEFVVHIDRRGHRLDFVVDSRQLFVFGDDRLRGGFGDVGIGGEHHGHRLADEPHLVDRQNRLIVERRTVIGIGDHLAHVVGGDDAKNARHRLRGAGVDRLDAAVCDGAAKDLAVQHPGQPHHMRVLGAAGDLLACFEAWNRAADLAAAHWVH